MRLPTCAPCSEPSSSLPELLAAAELAAPATVAVEAVSRALAAPAAPLSRWFCGPGAGPENLIAGKGTLGGELAEALRRWAGVCNRWAAWWLGPSEAPIDAWVSIGCVEEILCAVRSMEQIRAAVLGGSRGQVPGSAPGAAALPQPGLATSLWLASIGLVSLAHKRLRETGPSDGGAWRHCLAQLCELLQGAAWELPQSAEARDAWQGGLQLAAALMHHGWRKGFLDSVPADQAPEAAAAAIKLAHALVGDAACCWVQRMCCLHCLHCSTLG